MEDPCLTVCNDTFSHWWVMWPMEPAGAHSVALARLSLLTQHYPTPHPTGPNAHICCDVALTWSCWVPSHIKVRAPPWVIKHMGLTRYSVSEQHVLVNLWGLGNRKDKTDSSGPPGSCWGCCSTSWKTIRNKWLVLFILPHPHTHHGWLSTQGKLCAAWVLKLANVFLRKPCVSPIQRAYLREDMKITTAEHQQSPVLRAWSKSLSNQQNGQNPGRIKTAM